MENVFKKSFTQKCFYERSENNFLGKNKSSFAIYSLKVKKLKIPQNMKNMKNVHISAISESRPNFLGCEGHLGNESKSCHFGQDG